MDRRTIEEDTSRPATTREQTRTVIDELERRLAAEWVRRKLGR